MALIEKYPRLVGAMTAITIIWRRAAKKLHHRPATLPPINADYLPFHDHIDQRKNAKIGQMFRVFHRFFFSRHDAAARFARVMFPTAYSFYLFLRLQQKL